MTAMKCSRWPWGRMVTGVIAAVFLLVAGSIIAGSVDARRRADVAQVAEPICLEVDLSRPGEYEGGFRHSFTGAHGTVLQIETDTPLPSPEKIKEMFAGLSGHLAIADCNGDVVYKSDYTSDDVGCWKACEGQWIPMLGLGRFPTGAYVLRFTVTHGAPGLANIPHTLVARYELCGMEYAVPQMMLITGGVSGAIAGLLFLMIGIVTFTKGKR